jgi:hypothetical protein
VGKLKERIMASVNFAKKFSFKEVENGNSRVRNLYKKLCFKEDRPLSKELFRNNPFKDNEALKMFHCNLLLTGLFLRATIKPVDKGGGYGYGK